MRFPAIPLALGFLALLAVARAPAEVLVDTNATWRLFKGRTEASSPDLTAWRGRNFDDAAFTDAPGPFWYGDVLIPISVWGSPNLFPHFDSVIPEPIRGSPN